MNPYKKYQQWKEVPMPDCIANLPKDERGFPIPVNVSRINGKPVFKANDTMYEIELALANKCTVTGVDLSESTRRMVTSPLNAFRDKIITVMDSPVHVDALKYSLKVCPYLCLNKHYKGFDINGAEKLAEKYGTKGFKFISSNTTITSPPFMVMIQATNIGLVRNDVHSFMYTINPKRLISMECYHLGDKISVKEAEPLLRDYLDESEIQEKLKKFRLDKEQIISNFKTRVK